MATRDATERAVGQRAERTGVRLTGPAAAYIVSRGLAKAGSAHRDADARRD
jgi:hypothetical protein